MSLPLPLLTLIIAVSVTTYIFMSGGDKNGYAGIMALASLSWAAILLLTDWIAIRSKRPNAPYWSALEEFGSSLLGHHNPHIDGPR